MAQPKRPKSKRGPGCGSLIKRAKRGAWIAVWTTADGRRREKSTRCTDYRAAERILNAITNEEALRRKGIINIDDERHALAGRRPLAEHADAYLKHCTQAHMAADHVAEKSRVLKSLIKDAGVIRLVDLTPDNVGKFLRELQKRGQAGRTINAKRANLIAFATWCVKTGRLAVNQLLVVPKLNEELDRRRIRRALSDDESARLLAVAEDRGRKAWYLSALLAGLRKGDMVRLEWRDVDFSKRTLTLREGKSGRTDIVPLHPQLATELMAIRRTALPTARIFSRPVSDKTRQKDFLRAGLARVVEVPTGAGTGGAKGRNRRPQTRIITEDEEGRVMDLHSLRTTFGTNLARAGVPPEIIRILMRHKDYRTTEKHYVVLGQPDLARGLVSLPWIHATNLAHPASYHPGAAQQRAQRNLQQSACNSSPTLASGREVRATSSRVSHAHKGVISQGLSRRVRAVSRRCVRSARWVKKRGWASLAL